MAGPNSIPNGDTTVMRGHMNEKFVCTSHAQVVSLSSANCGLKHSEDRPAKVIPLRWYLEARGKLRTGKTRPR